MTAHVRADAALRYTDEQKENKSVTSRLDGFLVTMTEDPGDCLAVTVRHKPHFLNLISSIISCNVCKRAGLCK